MKVFKNSHFKMDTSYMFDFDTILLFLTYRVARIVCVIIAI